VTRGRTHFHPGVGVWIEYAPQTAYKIALKNFANWCYILTQYSRNGAAL
jgi:hypothetical protein